MNRPRIMRAVRFTVTVLAVAWLASQVQLDTLVGAFAQLGWRTIALAFMFTLCSACACLFRWYWVLEAYGAEHLPKPAWLVRHYFIGMFYNLAVPGGVGGDVYRGVVVRRAFDGEHTTGMTRGLVTTVVERALGMISLMWLVSTILAIQPVAWLAGARVAAIGLLVVTVVALLALAAAQIWSHRIPGRAGRFLSQLPRLRRPSRLMFAVLIGLFNHLFIALAGHYLVHALAPHITVADSLSVVPLANATALLPISVGGAGVREAAFTLLYGTLGVSAAYATAASLALFGIQLTVSTIGGVYTLIPEGEDTPTQRG